MLRDKLGGMTRAQRTATLATLAGHDGVRTLTALYDAGSGNLDKWRKGLGEAGTAAEVAARKQSNFKGKLENLKGSIETAAIAIGTKMLPALTKAAKDLTNVINDPKLTGGEKFQKIAEMAGKAFEKAIPILADKAAQAAPVVAGAFVKGFLGCWCMGTARYRRVLAVQDGWSARVHEGRCCGWGSDEQRSGHRDGHGRSEGQAARADEGLGSSARPDARCGYCSGGRQEASGRCREGQTGPGGSEDQVNASAREREPA